MKRRVKATRFHLFDTHSIFLQTTSHGWPFILIVSNIRFEWIVTQYGLRKNDFFTYMYIYIWSKGGEKGRKLVLVIDPYSELGSGSEFRFRNQYRRRTRPGSQKSLRTTLIRCRGKSGSVHGWWSLTYDSIKWSHHRMRCVTEYKTVRIRMKRRVKAAGFNLFDSHSIFLQTTSHGWHFIWIVSNIRFE